MTVEQIIRWLLAFVEPRQPRPVEPIEPPVMPEPPVDPMLAHMELIRAEGRALWRDELKRPISDTELADFLEQRLDGVSVEDWRAHLRTTDDYKKLHAPKGSSHIPKGIVRGDGRSWVDDNGAFYPFGATLFWALYGWKHGDRDRVRQHFAWLRNKGFDYIRILGQVDWSNQVIDPEWPDYKEQLGSLIDTAFDDFGLRTQITIFGSHYQHSSRTGQKVAQVILENRMHKILCVEMANESFKNFGDFALLQQLTKGMKGLIPNLVAISAPGPGTWEPLAQSTVPTCRMFHPDRDLGDNGWRVPRQAWDVSTWPKEPTSINEPIGPQATVNETYDPLLLAMLRASGIVSGAGAFVFHTGSGVYGRVVGNRTANIWEVPGVDAMVAALRDVDKFLPRKDIANWTKANAGWTAPNPIHPLQPTGQFNKSYAAISNDGYFCAVVNGISDVNLTAVRAVKFTAMEPGEAAKFEIAGSGMVYHENHRDDHNALLVYGQFL